MSSHCQLQSSAWVFCPNPTFQHPAPVCSGGSASQAGWAGQASGPHVQVSPCPAATRGLSCSLPQRMRLSFCPNWAPRWGASLDVQNAPHFHVPPGLQAPSHFLSSSFSFFFLLFYLVQQECICPCRFPRASASGQLGSMRRDPFLMYSWSFGGERSLCLPNTLGSWSFLLYFLFELVKG